MLMLGLVIIATLGSVLGYLLDPGRTAAENIRRGRADSVHRRVAEALNCLRRHSTVAGDDLSPLLRVETASYFGRADEIAEKHRQMAPLALGHLVWLAVFAHDGCGCGLG